MRLHALTRCLFSALMFLAASTSFLPPRRSLVDEIHSQMDKTEDLSRKRIKSEENASEDSVLNVELLCLDAHFFNKTEMLDMAEGAKKFNVPMFRVNRRLVASADGGLSNPSVLVFNSSWSNFEKSHENEKFKYPSLQDVKRPIKEDDIAYMTVLELAALIKTKQITSLELMDIFLRRLKKYNDILEAVITFTEDLAYSQAKEADELIKKGVYLGPLHGIPYGLKDIIAVPHYKTTWGSKTFKDQYLNIEAWVYKRLKSSGAVLLAKLVSGSLAYDDIWFGGRTRNPWNIKEFSTGSSAGPAASTSAGLVPFAIGSETAGSMTYPAARCGITCLRPTFGTVGRSGVMSISESLDKLGPFCRSAVDCAIVIDAVRGKDPDDLSSRVIFIKDPFSIDVSKLTVGYLEDAEMEVVDVLKSKGVKVVPFKLNYTVESVQAILNFTMDVDMLAHFDHWQRSGEDRQYEAQDQWPEELRRARLIPAVDYLQAQRARGKLIREIRESFTVDAFIGNATDWELVCLGNLVGMPIVVVPTGFKSIEDPPKGGTRRRTTVTTGIYAPPDHDHIALALAMTYQSVTNHHRQRPPIDDLGPNDKVSIPSKTT
ncbi:glutamyl-tRNA(Gln) amidotransferase subunit A [Dioscorea cayenensis subsp. rotundata]|uniref:Glutamyl-tRNA(Gln) amidotransferase subunit A n=1 Tax=Dioscorea cayennensis subsp. rotundata TaxID=55577 RepID=A0AB40BE92_DIOCR|nr:glutamyl-tRNA(Gln) amidotransferase subunit A [Dioscorea cayenensis subsp. rotundata]